MPLPRNAADQIVEDILLAHKVSIKATLWSQVPPFGSVPPVPVPASFQTRSLYRARYVIRDKDANGDGVSDALKAYYASLQKSIIIRQLIITDAPPRNGTGWKTKMLAPIR